MTDSVEPNATNNVASTFLPRLYRTDANTKFLQATVEQMSQRGTVSKLNGFIGRQSAKATTGNDVFINSPEKSRQDYQLEPSIVVNDQEGNNSYFKDYQDYINRISSYGGNVSNHARLNTEEFYSWDPRINWDKFVNFQNYYWITPAIITINGQQRGVVSTFSVSTNTVGNTTEYVFTPNGISEDPVVTLYKGQTYHFIINCPGNPFSIKTSRSVGTSDRYNTENISGNGIENGVLTFTVPDNAPSTLYYQSETNINAGGIFKIKAITQNTAINVSEEILGKTSYTLSNGIPLSNGMMVSFSGDIIPTLYSTGTYYVEGVGVAIKLISADQIDNTTTPEYIVINRASTDKNPWSRVNRWVHADVINTSDSLNQIDSQLNQYNRAVRPIIEFSENLKLFNYGTEWLMDVDFLDEYTNDALSLIEGSSGYYIDGNQILDGQHLIVVNDGDVYVRNNIYKVVFLNSKIHLELVAEPVSGQVVYITNGVKNKDKYIWFDGANWIRGQQKLDVNQPPLFDVVDSNDNSFGDLSVYNGSSFTGTKVFSYEVGTSGIADDKLGFKLSYRNINNIGDIVFNFNFVNDTFNYKELNDIITKNISTGYLKYRNYTGENVYTNGWVKASISTVQAGVRVYKNSGIVNKFNIDIYDDKTLLTDLVVRVYVNGTRLQQYTSSSVPNWVITGTIKYKQVILLNSNKVQYVSSTEVGSNLITTTDTTSFTVGQLVIFSAPIGGLQKNTAYYITSIPSVETFTVSTHKNGEAIELLSATGHVQLYFTADIQETDILTLRTFSEQPINSFGYYEIPNNLQNNPLNDTIKSFTLGEVINHVDSIVDNLSSEFVGIFPGTSNLRDLGDVSTYGTKFVKHSGPSSISMYHMTADTADIIKAIENSRDDYNKFKRKFITVSETMGVDTTVKEHVDLILQSITKNIPSTSPYYFSDMVPFGASVKTTYKISGFTTQQFPLNTPYDMTVLSNRAVGVYVNEEQLIIGHEYLVNSQGFLEIKIPLANDDEVVIYEYENTDGCFIPETPTKLGIWPLFDPKIYKDTTLVTPQWMIQGHDGSLVLAYGTYDDNGVPDYRDSLILELEKRIYNNIKIKYDTNIFDITDILPSYTRKSVYSLAEFNQVLAPSFYKWTSFVDVDFSSPIGFNEANPFTFNYLGNSSLDGRSIPGYWRGIYQWMLDTDRPHICPWEMLGVYDKPAWWDTVYGPAPYTSDNLIMWKDISDGLLNEPSHPVLLPRFKRPFLINHIPVDENGNLVDPITSGMAIGSISNDISSNFLFGDVSPVESAWRRSSYFPFSVILTAVLLTPSKTLGILLDRSRISRNLTGQLVYETTGLHVTPSTVKIPSIYSSESRIQSAGIINYIVNHIISDNLITYNQYSYDLSNISYRLSYRIGGFTSKNQFNLILDSKSPLTTGNVFVPQDDYDIILNTSSPTKKITYSGVIVSKTYDGYSIKGYSQTQPYFTYYEWLQSGATITVGGISENFVLWTAGKTYSKGQIVKFGNEYYAATNFITGEMTFDTSKYKQLPSLPIVGGRTATFRKVWNKNAPITIPYNTKFNTVQDVVDFLTGYGEWLKEQGFIFDEFNSNLNHVSNWETSAKEFMFWTTQNWSAGQDTWEDWKPSHIVTYNSVVRYEGLYYRAMRNIPASSVFEYQFYEKLDGLSTVGSSIISLSPAAESITFSTTLNVVDDITNQYNDYELLRVDGQPILPQFLSSSRNRNLVTYKPTNDDGIYNASFYLVQKEHIVIIKNTTMFNDLIYDPTSGYKQDRIKVSAYVSTEWYGGFDIPGFIFDEAKVYKWESWKDYALGDVVQYQSFFYSASSFISGTEEFDSTQWIRLTSKPSPKIMPNWTNIATQFTDFYSLDDDHFDSAQQTMAQHLIGYQKRQYLDNIIQDDVSEFKFYQGMIAEKGTQNVFNKLFGVLSSEQKESLTFYEEWAVRVGQYGASSAFDEIELVLDEEQFKNNPQVYELVDTKSVNSGRVIQQIPSDLYLKPVDYSSNIWPVLTTDKKVLRSGGYVRSDEVLLTLASISDIVNQDITMFTEGDYVWCTFHNTSWDVYRYTTSNLVVSDITYNSNQLTITVSGVSDINPGDYIGIVNVLKIAGFYQVVSYTSNSIIVNAPGITFNHPTHFNDIKVYHLTTQRAPSINDAAHVLHYPLKANELVWTDDNGTGKWGTWIYNSVYSGKLLSNPYPLIEKNYGRSIASDTSGNFVAISTAAGEVYVYRVLGNNVRKLHQVISKPFISVNDQNTQEKFGEVVSISRDGKWLAIGSPKISYACTELSNIDIRWDNDYLPFSNTNIKFDNNIVETVTGEFIIGTTYTITYIGDTDFTLIGASGNVVGTIFVATGVGNGTTGTAVNTSPIQAGYFVIGTTYTITSIGNTNFISIGAKRNQIGTVFVATGIGSGTGMAVRNIINASSDLVFTTTSGLNSGFTQQGVVSLYTLDSYDNYYLVGTFVSPQPMSNELFGSTLEFGLDSLYIGAPGRNELGNVYKINYNMVVNASGVYDPFNSSGTTLNLVNAPGINVFGMYIIGAGFNNNQKVIKYDPNNPTTLTLTANPDTQPVGNVKFATFNWQYSLLDTLVGDTTGGQFGSKIKLSNDDITLLVSSVGKVEIYKNNTLFQSLTGQTTAFGNSISVSNDGSYIAISDSMYTGTYSQQGKVVVYSQLTSTSIYTLYQDIENLYPSVNAEFGVNISFMDDNHTLVIHSKYANSPSSYVDVYDRYGSNWVFSERLPLLTFSTGKFIVGNSYTISSIGTTTNTQWNTIGGTTNVNYIPGTTFTAATTGEGFGTGTAVINIDNDAYTMGFAISAFSILIGTPMEYDRFDNSGLVYEYKKAGDVYSWALKHQEIDKPDVSKIKKVFLYNKTKNELVSYLDVIDPLQGKIAGPAEQELSYKTLYDPAVYSIGNSDVNVDEGIAWTDRQVGKLWWDLRTAKFIECYDSDITYRTSTWNTLVYGASIDIYEWVETKLMPSSWDSQADTESGLALGISGTSLYGDSCYSVKTYYDNVSKTLKNTYYYWVKNKAVVPATTGRYTSAQNISNMIASPLKNAYKHVSFTSTNTFEIANVGQILSDKDIVLSIQYWLVDRTDQNVHSQWKIISNDPGTIIPDHIEQKWFDSLCGADSLGRTIPDIKLPPKLKYGIENRPRQGMFVNRYEALKQYIEQTNIVLLKNQIASSRTLGTLEQYDAPPLISTGLYDIIINTDAELQFVNTSSYKQPDIKPVIEDGKIIGIIITNSGFGYIEPPVIEIKGSGINASLRTEINEKGQIKNIVIVNSGEGYDNTTTLSVRKFSVLVLSDSQSSNNWAIYSYDLTSKEWNRILIQSYDNRNYWYYKDWYYTGYNQFTATSQAVDNFPDLIGIDTKIGDIIKVRFGNNGKWVLIKRYSSVESLDWTAAYNVIGIQDGTIQISSTLYDAHMAQYDGTLYDSIGYDSTTTIELRNILTAIKNDIFINDLKVEYLNLFFNSVRYAYNEQNYIDWIFKTSFVKATHNVGKLNQPVTFKNDNLNDFESYVAEVKPYRTKVREYISSYTNIDNGTISISDFDLPPVYAHGGTTVVESYVVNNKLQTYNTAIKSFPWKSWFEHAGFSIASVNITNPGYGYIEPPTVEVISLTGTGAVLIPELTNGRVSSITIKSGGSGYLTPPTLIFSPPPFGQPTSAIAIIGNSLVRTNSIKMKFDRITSNYYINKLEEIEVFTAVSQQHIFNLLWAPDIKIGYSTVSINDKLITSDLYTISTTITLQDNGHGIVYSRKHGVVSINNSININASDVISITYKKDVSILNAADRIHFYYNASSTSLGSDLSQLMTGIDYGGVIVDGISFDVNRGWDSLPYLSDRWDSYDPTFTDYTVIASAGNVNSNSFTLPYIPVSGTVINVYVKKSSNSDKHDNNNYVRLDDINFNTISQTVSTAIMGSPVIGEISELITVEPNGNITINIPLIFKVKLNDIFIFRESTSDGSVKTFESDYDTSYDGGNMAYTSASGYNPEDIIIDGDGFVTPMTSNAPEEVVPGQIVDALSIKVLEQNEIVSGNIKVSKYAADGIKTDFDAGQRLNNNQSVIVAVETFTTLAGKVSSETLIKELDIDYTINYSTNTVIFNEAPSIGSEIALYSIGVNSTNTIDIDYLVSNGTSTLYSTKTIWNADYLVDVFVNGKSVAYTLVNHVGLLSIQFGSAPAKNAMISYIVVNSNITRTFTITTTEHLMIPSGGLSPSTPIAMASIVGTSANMNDNMIVIVDQTILLPTEYNYYPPVNNSTPKISFAIGLSSANHVTIVSSYNNAILQVERSQISMPMIIHSVDSAAYYRDLSAISGTLSLPKIVKNENYLWVIKNGTLLIPGIDFILNEDKVSITVATDPENTDVFDVITFNSNTTSNIGYLQFKDMLNRTYYKDIDTYKQSLLTADLNYDDLYITVDNASVFDIPEPSKNIPGVVIIGTERIEYFEINGNNLGQLRRATLGTGASPIYAAGTMVQNIGPSTNISYHDRTVSQTVIVTQAMLNNDNIIDIDFTPNVTRAGNFKIGNTYIIKTIGVRPTDFTLIGATNNNIGTSFIATGIGNGDGTACIVWEYEDPSFVSTIPQGYGQCDDIEVFIGGYDIKTWTAGTTYAVGDIVLYGSYTYKCEISHISGVAFTDLVSTVIINSDTTTTVVATGINADSVWATFITNVRLKKEPYKVFNVNKSPYSPAGDIQYDADFSVNGTSSTIRLTNPVPVGTNITIVKQYGSKWNNKYSIL